jgi:ferredoxin
VNARAGRLTEAALAALAVPTSADAYLCGPASFTADIEHALTGIGLDPARVHTELFTARAAITPGLVERTSRRPHRPTGPAATGPLVTFTRSDVATAFPESARSVLELAEACDVPTRWSCRTGVCHTCVTPLLSGEVRYAPPPLEPPPDAQVLICCAQPTSDVVLDL